MPSEAHWKPASVDLERAQLYVSRGGRVRGAPLKPVHRVVLCYLLSEQARYGNGKTIFQKNIARELGLHRLQVQRAIAALRRWGLVLTILIQANHEKPWSSRASQPEYTRNKILRYWCRADRILAPEPPEGLSGEPSDGSCSEPSPRRERSCEEQPPPTPATGDALAQADAPAGHRESRATLTRPPRPRRPCRADARGESRPGAEEQAAGRDAQGRSQAPREASPELEAELTALAVRWNCLGMPHANGSASSVGPRERQAWRNRLAEGCTVGELAEAIVGADKGDSAGWLRGGRARVGAFGVVFATIASVRRYAAEGRSAIDRGEAGRRVVSSGAVESDFVRRRQQQLQRAAEVEAQWEREDREKGPGDS
jgi:hypothetical protein